MTNLILCGGYGSRLWPLSRKYTPKQFLCFDSEYSLFQNTAIRNRELCQSTLIILGEDHYFQGKDQLEDIGINDVSFMSETIGRNTAPAIALGAMSVPADEILLVTPSDHRIANTAAYSEAVKKAVDLAENGNIVTFGIHPEYPETGYGYIEADGEVVSAFKEKPDAETAARYIEQGNYYWNSGMFCMKAGVFLGELNKFRPDIYDACAAVYADFKNSDSDMLPKEGMLQIPKESIDYAVMEKTDLVRVVPCDIGWADLGSIDSLYDKLDKNSDSNVVLNDGRVLSRDSSNNLVIGSGKTISLIGVDDLNIVETDDALLVTKRGASQDVKTVVDELELLDPELVRIGSTVKRPWGSYQVLEDSGEYKVKRIKVKPHSKLSLQSHKHRSEHWTVVQGQARIYCNDDILVRNTGEFVVIPVQAKHRLENIGEDELIVVEVQMGEYLGEDDIIRYEDDYARG